MVEDLSDGHRDRRDTGQQMRGDRSHLLDPVCADLLGGTGNQYGHVQPGQRRHVQSGKAREPPPDVRGQGKHVRVEADQHMPVDQALARRWLYPVPPPVGHLGGKPAHVASSSPLCACWVSSAVVVNSWICCRSSTTTGTRSYRPPAKRRSRSARKSVTVEIRNSGGRSSIGRTCSAVPSGSSLSKQAIPAPILMGVDRPVRWDRLIFEPSAVSTGRPRA